MADHKPRPLFAVGDEVIHTEPFYGRRAEEVGWARVAKVGRKYAYITHPRWRTAETPFDKYTGIEHRNDGYNNNLQQIWVPSSYQAGLHRKAVLDALKDAGLEFRNYGHDARRYDTEVIERILAVIGVVVPVVPLESIGTGGTTEMD